MHFPDEINNFSKGKKKESVESYLELVIRRICNQNLDNLHNSIDTKFYYLGILFMGKLSIICK